MNYQKTLNKIRTRRKKRTRAKIYGTAEKPRLSVFRSNRYTYAQLINDENGKTLVSASTKELEKSKTKGPASANLPVGKAGASSGRQNSKLKLAERLGELLAKKAVEKGITKTIFNRGKYNYHGRIKMVAEGARKGSLLL